jgi:hypothetical protein
MNRHFAETDRPAWGQTFEEAVGYFRQKTNLPTRTFRDIEGRANDRAFVVAGAMKAELLADLRAAIDKGVAGQMSLAEFREQFDAIVKKHGWTGWTGEGSAADRAWRARVIYETNLKTAYAAGRYAQMTDPDVVKVQKWWRYRHAFYRVPERARPDHESWDGLVLAWNDAWWDTHYPPNGWNCSCGVETLSDEDLAEDGVTPDASPPIVTRGLVDPATGRVVQVPNGIDLGWDHAPGRDWSRGLVPRNLQAPLEPLMPNERVSARVIVPAMPPPRAFTAPLLESGQPAERYVERFLAAFGAAIGQPVMVRDAAGHAIVVSQRLFASEDGALKVLKRGREAQVLRLAETIQDPDEIWVSWWRASPVAPPALLRSYLRRGLDSEGFGLFQWSTAGWRGMTAFPPDSTDYLLRQRQGALIWRRGTD